MCGRALEAKGCCDVRMVGSETQASKVALGGGG